MDHQLSLHRIHVHVVQLLDKLLLTPHVEIVKTRLPELRQKIVSLAKRQAELLPVRFLPSFSPEVPRDALFQDLHHSRRRNIWRLADQEVHVLGHDDVTREFEMITIAYFSENFDKGVFGPHLGKERQAAVAAAGDEMQMLEPVAAAQSFGHEGRTKSPALPRDGRTDWIRTKAPFCDPGKLGLEDQDFRRKRSLR